MRVATEIELTPAQRERLVRTAESQTIQVQLARRARIVLLCADGLDNKTLGEMLGIDRIQVARWRMRYGEGGLAAIGQDLPRGGRTSMVERLRHSVFRSVPELARAINDYVAHHNQNPKPFIWTSKAKDILERVIRANSRFRSKQSAILH